MRMISTYQQTLPPNLHAHPQSKILYWGKDLEQYPEGGFQMKDALTREETLKGMTIWAAYSNFKENEKGSIEVGKKADFVVLSHDIMTIEADSIPYIEAEQVFVGGEAVKRMN